MTARALAQGLLATLASVAEGTTDGDRSADRLRQAGLTLGQELERRWRTDEQPGAPLERVGLASLAGQIARHLAPGARVAAEPDRLVVTFPAGPTVTGRPGAGERLLAATLGGLAARQAGRATTRLTLEFVDVEPIWVLTIRLAPVGERQPDEEEYRQEEPRQAEPASSALAAPGVEEPPHDARLRAIGEMAVSAAHGLNNLLAAVADQSAQLLREPEQTSAGSLRLIHQAALDGAGLARRLLQFSRGTVTLSGGDVEPVDLNAVIRDAVELTRPRWRDEAARHGVPIRLQVEAAGPAVVSGVASELREALVNLIVNAVDAMPRGGTLTLQSDAADGLARVICQDTGVGMPPDVRARVFQPFFTTKGTHGTGMGLAIVYGIVARHGGEVAVESEPGRGATFTLTLPAAPHPAMAADLTQPPAAASLPGEPGDAAMWPARDASGGVDGPRAGTPPGGNGGNASEDAGASGGRGGGDSGEAGGDGGAGQDGGAGRGDGGDPGDGEPAPLTILVVDDDAAFRAVFSRRLQADGHDVVVVGDAATALQRLDEVAWDLICIDKRLPDQPGPELARTIRQRRPDTYVALVSGYAAGPNDPDLMTPDVDAVLPKPSREAELSDVLRQASARRRRSPRSNLPDTAEPPAE